MFTISREYWFSAAHRIEGHPKCGRLHGHNYKVIVTLVSEEVDAQGMILDYGELDHIVKPIIDALDHRYIASLENVTKNDPYIEAAYDRGDAVVLKIAHSTAECLAEYFHGCISEALGPDADVAVAVHETPRSAATYTSYE